MEVQLLTTTQLQNTETKSTQKSFDSWMFNKHMLIREISGKYILSGNQICKTTNINFYSISIEL